MTSVLVLTAKVWPVKPVKESRDTSTNTGVLGSRGQSRPLKPAVVSFREERARWEWPRRATLAGRQNQVDARTKVGNGVRAEQGSL
jgi:hypothetical protein